MVKLFYSTLISVDLAKYEIFRAKVGNFWQGGRTLFIYHVPKFWVIVVTAVGKLILGIRRAKIVVTK